MSQQNGTDVQCSNCEYEWSYTGTLGLATCPNCNHKTRVGVQS